MRPLPFPATRMIAVLALGGAAAGAAISLGAVAASSDGASHASATLVDATGATVGWASFTEDATGTLHVNVKVAGLTSGEHGIHIHSIGACTPDFSAAGGHHNPGATLHGAHAGDLPNLIVNVAGQGHLDGTTDAATLSDGPVSIFDADGSALVIHANPDDYVTQPIGNSGPRIACGVIVAD
jgi:superoxide dismutase, Cu-Zn family